MSEYEPLQRQGQHGDGVLTNWRGAWLGEVRAGAVIPFAGSNYDWVPAPRGWRQRIVATLKEDEWT